MSDLTIHIKPPILVPDLAARLGLKGFQVLGDLIKLGVFPAPGQPLEPSVAAKVCTIHGFCLQGFSNQVARPGQIARDASPVLSDLDKSRAELRAMIGLEDVKDRVNKIIDLVRWQNALKETKGKTPEISHHMIFTGNPGTGKTTVARIMGDFFKSLKLLSKGHFTEVDRQGLVGGYVGQTAEKTMKVLKEALGGVLFIDEAYSLVGGSDNDFGKEAINTLLKFMEDNRGNLIVIAAGYEADMDLFVQSNPGLESRFKTRIDFPDYTKKECLKIFEELARSFSLIIENDKTLVAISEKIESSRKLQPKNFANGRKVRNLFETIIGNVATRVYGEKGAEMDRDIYTIKFEDIESKVRV